MTTGARAKRQAEFLECITELIRASAKHPDLRFGQLLVEAVGGALPPDAEAVALFHMPNTEIAQRVRAFADKAV